MARSKCASSTDARVISSCPRCVCRARTSRGSTTSFAIRAHGICLRSRPNVQCGGGVVPSHELVEALNVEANGQSTPPCESLLDACMHEAHRSRAKSLVLSSAWSTVQPSPRRRRKCKCECERVVGVFLSLREQADSGKLPRQFASVQTRMAPNEEKAPTAYATSTTQVTTRMCSGARHLAESCPPPSTT